MIELLIFLSFQQSSWLLQYLSIALKIIIREGIQFLLLRFQKHK